MCVCVWYLKWSTRCFEPNWVKSPQVASGSKQRRHVPHGLAYISVHRSVCIHQCAPSRALCSCGSLPTLNYHPMHPPPAQFIEGTYILF